MKTPDPETETVGASLSKDRRCSPPSASAPNSFPPVSCPGNLVFCNSQKLILEQMLESFRRTWLKGFNKFKQLAMQPGTVSVAFCG